MTRFIGIDFSTTSTGVAIHDINGWMTQTVKSKGGRAETDRDFYQRMRTLNAEVLALVDAYPDDVIAMESTFRGSGRAEARLHFAWHRFREALASGWGCTVRFEIAPSTVKYLATGHGGAATTKERMLAAAQAHLGLELGNRDDEADAAWIAVGASVLAGEPVIDLPAEQFPKAWKGMGLK